MKYCTACERNVSPKKKFNWVIFVLGLLSAGIISTLYVIYYFLFQKRQCPICYGKSFTKSA